MLTRIISAAVGIAVAITVLFLHKTIVLPIAIAFIIAVMLFELIRAVKLEKCIPLLIPAEICGIAVPFLHWYETKSIAVFAVVLFCTFAVFTVWLNKHEEIQYTQIFFVLACMFVIPQAMSTIVLIEKQAGEHSVFFIVMGLCGAWIADSGAYFTGVAVGKHKLCPKISPKKTVEGLIGGIVSTGIFFVIAFYVNETVIANHFNSAHMYLGAWGYSIIAVIGMVCAVIGTIGDLSASMVKRQIGFKDYGKIMPGHGGFMDRFDSVLFVLPTFYAFISITGLIHNVKM
ncbi:MAG: phosphatidate cytidylyltransferase [Ruminococcus sp.]|nr:phosphatidate cytidylyltransferase [Ruminococcus sp.]